MNGTSSELTLACLLRAIYMMAWNKFKFAEERQFLAEDTFQAADIKTLIALKRAAESNKLAAETDILNNPKTADPTEAADWETVIYMIKEQMKRGQYR